jgi:hypothetical protein
MSSVVMTNEHLVYHVATIAQLEIHRHRRRLPEVDPTLLPFKCTLGPGDGPFKGSPLRRALMLAS